jgi:hypothetical protein
VFFKGRRNSEQRSTETEGQNEIRMERKGTIKETSKEELEKKK